MGAFISLLLAVDATWPAVSSSCHSDFPAMMDCNLEFWAKSQLFLPYIAIFFQDISSQHRKWSYKKLISKYHAATECIFFLQCFIDNFFLFILSVGTTMVLFVYGFTFHGFGFLESSRDPNILCDCFP